MIISRGPALLAGAHPLAGRQSHTQLSTDMEWTVMRSVGDAMGPLALLHQ